MAAGSAVGRRTATARRHRHAAPESDEGAGGPDVAGPGRRPARCRGLRSGVRRLRQRTPGLQGHRVPAHRAGRVSPSANDPDRNRHRLASHGAWSTGAIRAILMNPSISASGRGAEPAARTPARPGGRVVRLEAGRPSRRRRGLAVVERPHAEAIVSSELLAAADASGCRRRRSKPRTAKATHPYALRGMLWCGMCAVQRPGTTPGGDHHVRQCPVPLRLTGPTTPATRPWSASTPPPPSSPRPVPCGSLTAWLAQLFTPERIAETVDNIHAALSRAGPRGGGRVADHADGSTSGGEDRNAPQGDRVRCRRRAGSRVDRRRPQRPGRRSTPVRCGRGGAGAAQPGRHRRDAGERCRRSPTSSGWGFPDRGHAASCTPTSACGSWSHRGLRH